MHRRKPVGKPQVRTRSRAQLDALARADLLAIARHDFGAPKLPNNADGRLYFRAFILKGMPVTQLLRMAPWARHRDFFRIVNDADAERGAPNAKRLGALIEFTLEKLVALKRDHGISIRHIEPCDAEVWQVEDFWKAERQEADRMRKQRERTKEQDTMPIPTKRATLVRKAMSETHWTSVSAIMKAVARTLRDQRNQRLTPHALRVAVHRALDDLLACGLAEEKTGADKRGFPVRLARRADTVLSMSAHVADPITTGVSGT